MHQVTGRWKLGLALALLTAVLWGVLPIALKVALQGMNAYTITWYRLAVAGVVLFGILAFTGGLPKVRGLGRHTWRILVIGILGLTGNYVLYLVSLDHTSPAVAQVVIQLGPMFFLLGGLVIFREKFSPLQWLGFATLIIGLLLFFNKRLPQLLDITSGTGLGVVLLIIAALTWAIYALVQKSLLKQFKPQQILLLVYLGSIVLLFPSATPQAVTELTTLQAWMLTFACANTLVAYGAFAEALVHWEASRVGAVLSLAPLFTLVGVWLAEHLTPGLIAPEGLNILSVSGALMVVAGSAVCALGKQKSI